MKLVRFLASGVPPNWARFVKALLVHRKVSTTFRRLPGDRSRHSFLARETASNVQWLRSRGLAIAWDDASVLTRPFLHSKLLRVRIDVLDGEQRDEH
jgi:hypothetical protein